MLLVGVVCGYIIRGDTGTSKNVNQLSEKESVQPKISEAVDKSRHTLIGSCSSKECLFANDEKTIEGYAKLKGYYHKYESDNFGTLMVCDSLIVTGGSQALIDNFTYLIDEGNSLNKIDKNGNLLVNIKSNELSPIITQKIKSSNINNQIELDVIRKTPEGRGASTCTSFIEILSVN